MIRARKQSPPSPKQPPDPFSGGPPHHPTPDTPTDATALDGVDVAEEAGEGVKERAKSGHGVDSEGRKGYRQPFSLFPPLFFGQNPVNCL